MSKVLDKVSKLLAQAENAGTPEEAETFMAKAQEMATINEIDLAVARMHQAKKEKVQEPEERSIQMNPRTRRNNRKQFVELGMALADVNDCTFLIGGKDSRLLAVGFPADLDVVEALFVHLSVQMTAECDAALKRGEHKDVRKVARTVKVEIPFEERDWAGWDSKRNRYYDPPPSEIGWSGWDEERYEQAIAEGEQINTGCDQWGNPQYRKPVPPPKYREEYVLDDDGEKIYDEKEVSLVDGRVFRSEFYDAFIRRMRGRLWEAKRDVEKAMGVDRKDESNEKGLALRDKKAEVDKATEEQRAGVRHIGTYKSSNEVERKRDYTGRGSAAGHEAAGSVAVGAAGRGVEKA